jgi:hypothetical protein
MSIVSKNRYSNANVAASRGAFGSAWTRIDGCEKRAADCCQKQQIDAPVGVRWRCEHASIRKRLRCL